MKSLDTMKLLRLSPCIWLISSVYILLSSQHIRATSCAKLLAGIRIASIESTGYPRYSGDILKQMISKLEKSQGTITVRDQEVAGRGGFDAHYNRFSRSIGINPRDTEVDQFVRYYHETVHSTTDHKVRDNPGSPETAFAIVVTRKDQPIDPSLPDLYHAFYQIDEMKAYHKTSKLLSQIAREYRVSQDSRTEKIERIALETKVDSESFAEVTFRILSQTENVILDAAEGKPVGIKAFLYAKNVPNVFMVNITLIQPSGTPIIVKLPVYDPATINGTIENLYVKLFRVVRNGKVIARKYISSSTN